MPNPELTLIVLGFLLLTLLLGLFVSKNNITFREYAVGNKRFQTTTLTITIVATAIGGGALIRIVPNVYRFNIFYICIVILGAIKPILIISILALRMGPFMHHLSFSETIGSAYGKYIRAIAALLGIYISIGYVAIEINIMSHGMQMCLDMIDHRITIVLATFILIAYTMLGGVRAITITDVLQFVTFMTMLALLVKVLFIQTGKSFLEVVWMLKGAQKLQLSHLFQGDSNNKLVHLGVYFIGSFFYITPAVIHRLYISSGPIQAYKSFSRAGLLNLIIKGCVVLMGLLVIVWHPKLPLKEFWPYILDHMSPAYKIFFVVCILGMTMSTADSNLHIASIMVSHDIVEVIKGVKSGSYIHKIQLAKLTIIATGLLAMILAVFYPDIFQLSHFIMNYVMKIFILTVVPLFILAAFGFRGSTRTALMGMSTPILLYFCKKWIIYPRIIHQSNILALVNGLVMIAAYYLFPQPRDKGWIGKNAQYKKIQQLIRGFKKDKKCVDLE